MILQELFLTELDWHDRGYAATALEKHRGRWVHFTKVFKLGVNPRRGHTDPYGVYFYPVDWILDRMNETSAKGELYGQNSPYWFVADIDKSGPGVVLSEMTWDDVTKLAQKNGWYDRMRTFLARGTEGMSKSEAYEYKDIDIRTPARFFWDFCDALDRLQIMKWSRSLAGLDYVEDDGLGIIHKIEKFQIAALNPRIIHVVDSGKQPDWSGRRDRSLNQAEYWKPAIANLMREIAERYNGQMKWMHGIPSVSFRDQDHNFELVTIRDPLSLRLDWRDLDGVSGSEPITSNIDVWSKRDIQRMISDVVRVVRGLSK